jgi:hypothetical protein
LRKPEYPEETTGTWPAPKIPFIRCYLSSAASWDRTHTPHRHWLQVCDSDTSVAPWTVRPQFVASLFCSPVETPKRRSHSVVLRERFLVLTFMTSVWLLTAAMCKGE